MELCAGANGVDGIEEGVAEVERWYDGVDEGETSS